MSIEQPKFEVVRQDGAIQVRDYAAVIVAETLVEGDFAAATNAGFRRLAGYIFGGNRGRAKIDMTAPVGQSSSASEKIAMTAPVGQAEQPSGGWLITFTMPSAYRMDTLPTPDDNRVTLREVPAQRVAASRFSGSSSPKRFAAEQRRLELWLAANGLQRAGETVFARYDPPWVPWFMRRNEVLVPIREA